MLRRIAASATVVILGASVLAGGASAARTVSKAPVAKPKVTTVVAVGKLVGTPLHGNPGDAVKAECQALADLAQDLHDMGGQDKAVDATLDLGVARGCVFTGGF